MLHHHNMHKLKVLSNKNKTWGYGQTILKRQIEYLKVIFCIVYRNGYKKAFLNSKGTDSQILNDTNENVEAP